MNSPHSWIGLDAGRGGLRRGLPDILSIVFLLIFVRAAERYAGITPEERERRRARGWGNDDEELQVSLLTFHEFISHLP